MPEYKKAQALAWVDLETTSLPVTGGGIVDYREVHVLEVAVILTDFDLQPYGAISSVVKMTRAAADILRATPEVMEMHKKNGLLKESIKDATMTLEDVDEEIRQLIKEETTFGSGEFMIAGSGVAAFDHPLIKAKMPKFNSYLAYYPFDIGIVRRMTKILAGKQVVNYAPHSYGDDKLHRALDDVKAHLDEAKDYREWFHKVAP